MTMITIIQVNPRLTSTFGPLPVIGAQRLMEGYDSLPPSLSYAAYYPPCRGSWGLVLPPTSAQPWHSQGIRPI